MVSSSYRSLDDKNVEKKGKIGQFLTSNSAKKMAIISIKVLKIAVVILMPVFVGVAAAAPILACPIIGAFTCIPIMALGLYSMIHILNNLDKVESHLKKSLKTQKIVNLNVKFN
ncbi:MAG: hypothetical protein QRY74_00930 [Chlamydia sp.]